MRAALLLFFVALATVLLLFLFSQDPGSSAASVLPAAGSSSAGMELVELPEAAADGLESGNKRQAAATEGNAEPAPDSVPVLGPRTITLRGIALRVDALGIEVRGEDGTFVLWVESEEGFVPLDVEVVAGEWQATFEHCESVWAEELMLGGLAVGLPAGDLQLPEDLFLILRGTTLQEVRLHVLADEDGSSLSGIEVHRGDVRWGGDYPYGEPLEPTGLLNVSSPLTMLPPPIASATDGKQGYWVRAAGRAWGGIEIDHGVGGERELRLQPGGELEIEIVGSPLPTGLVLRLYPNAYPRAASIELGREPAERNLFESLAQGEYRAVLELGFSGRAISFGEALVLVEPGRRTQVQLPLREINPPAQDVPVAGELRVPPGWPEVEAGLALTFEPVGETRSWGGQKVEVPHAGLERAGPGRYHFQTTLSHAGRYQVKIAPVAVRKSIEVDANGDRDLLFELPALTRLSLAVTAAASGEAVDAGTLTWMPAGAPNYSHTQAQPSPPAPPGRFELVVPAGDVEFMVWPDGGYASRSLSTFLRPGQADLTLEVEAVCGFALEFMDGETSVPFDTATRFRARTTAGADVELGWSSEGEIWFPAPGTYLFSMSDFAGFEAIEDLEVTLERRAIVPLALVLTRKD